MLRAWHTHVVAVVGYIALAVVFAWPLPARLGTFLAGPPDGDAGVYVWNQWVFHHELVERGGNPYRTETILAPTGPVSLSLHNYTELPNILALPFLDALGPVAAFNLVYLLLGVLTAYAMFRLVLAVAPGATAEAWLAGVLFAWSPMLVTRGATHLSLVAAAPLPLFMLALLRLERRRVARDGLLAGAAAALAAMSDAYYAVYSGLLVLVVLACATIRLERRPDPAKWITRGVDTLLVLVLLVTVIIALTGGGVVTVGGARVSLRTLYTPALALMVLLLLRAALGLRPVLIMPRRAELGWTVRAGLWALLAAAVLLAPRLYDVWTLAAAGGFVRPELLWRSSPGGVDLLALILPNPNHPFAPDELRGWLATLPSGDIENLASIPLAALLVIAAARWGGWRPPQRWTVVAVAFTLLALGPFLRVGGFNTALPLPWALLRYVPVVELARMPTRMSVVVMMAVAVLFPLALAALRARSGTRVVSAAGILLIAELLPAPRVLSSAVIPPLYARLASDPRPDAHVLELPFGVRDGTGSSGDFTARTLFHQTAHGKPILGGYLSRVPPGRVDALRKDPLFDALLRLSEGIEPQHPPKALAAAVPEFVERTKLAYVVIDRKRSPPRLTSLALDLFRLEYLGSDGDLELYRHRPHSTPLPGGQPF